ncbi:hypothetical protein M0802_007526 [Mischocyttarus mexicanus]|nr:hypothetical protein M0802_007526 [Mischocyttarus mexicanus]
MQDRRWLTRVFVGPRTLWLSFFRCFSRRTRIREERDTRESDGGIGGGKEDKANQTVNNCGTAERKVSLGGGGGGGGGAVAGGVGYGEKVEGWTLGRTGEGSGVVGVVEDALPAAKLGEFYS